MASPGTSERPEFKYQIIIKVELSVFNIYALYISVSLFMFILISSKVSPWYYSGTSESPVVKLIFIYYTVLYWHV